MMTVPCPEAMQADTPDHIPVMLDAVLEALDPQNEGHYIDATFGAGGYTQKILDAAPECRVTAIDRDDTAIAAGQAMVDAYAPRLRLVHGRFGDMGDLAADRAPYDGIVFDIGVSSMQIDRAERGFSFMRDGPLDMRMGPDRGESAADMIARIDEGDLAGIIRQWGEDRNARKIARAIVTARDEGPITRTAQLAEIISRAAPRRPRDKIHPATRTFQALRIAVNDELGELTRALESAAALLKPGGRLVVVTFHSLEDRIVKQFMKDRCAPAVAVNKYARAETDTHDGAAYPYRMLYRKAVHPTEDETARNPRARSAKLRAAIRTEAPA